jgi:uncharacterized protein YndB with AHSA1/START domain
MTTTLLHSLERSVEIRAIPETVFRFFTDEKRWAAWWGAGSTIDARRGGRVVIRYPDGTEASGEVIEISIPRRLVFTYGYATGTLIPPGGSRVTLRVEATAGGTRVHVTHDFADAAARDHHVQGWRYQLSLFANVVADEANAGAADIVDGWFGAWAIVDERAREDALARVAAPEVRVRDRFSQVDGVADLVPHIGASQRFMPGIRLERSGAIRHCQGIVLADWVAVSTDGQERASGTSVFALGLDGRIDSVTGFWNLSSTRRSA